MSSSPNPNRQRLMSPLDYLGALSGYKPPDPQPMPQVYDVPFRVHPMTPMPFVDMPHQQANPYLPAIPPEVVEARRRMGV